MAMLSYVVVVTFLFVLLTMFIVAKVMIIRDNIRWARSDAIAKEQLSAARGSDVLPCDFEPKHQLSDAGAAKWRAWNEKCLAIPEAPVVAPHASHCTCDDCEWESFGL
jgi:hypothetical protein